MPFLEAIVNQVNQSIKDNLSSAKFILSARGISKQLPREEDGIPAFVDQSGEGSFNAFDDNFSVCIYHRNETTSFETQLNSGFGDSDDLKRETANMVLICWADRRRVEVTQEQLAAAIVGSLPFSLGKTFVKDKNMTSALVEAVSIDHVSQNIWGREFKGIEFMLPPESIYFQINYRIETVYDKTCIEICEPC